MLRNLSLYRRVNCSVTCRLINLSSEAASGRVLPIKRASPVKFIVIRTARLHRSSLCSLFFPTEPRVNWKIGSFTDVQPGRKVNSIGREATGVSKVALYFAPLPIGFNNVSFISELASSPSVLAYFQRTRDANDRVYIVAIHSPLSIY